VPLYDAAAIVPALRTLAHVVGGLRFDRDAMRRATERGMLTATDLADHLARQGVPFREAHEIVGRLVRARLEQKKDLAGITIEELRAADRRFGDSAVDEVDVSRSLASRASVGGTAPERVRAALAEARTALAT
jgi:argininosuccinate lyase